MQATTADSEPLDFYVSFLDQHAVTGKVRALVDHLAEAMPAAWKEAASQS